MPIPCTRCEQRAVAVRRIEARRIAMTTPILTPGNWRPGKEPGTVVSDCKCDHGCCQLNAEFSYGGHLIAESIGNPADVPLIAAAKKTAEERDRLLAACKTLLADIDAGGIIDLTSVRDIIAETEGES